MSSLAKAGSTLAGFTSPDMAAKISTFFDVFEREGVHQAGGIADLQFVKCFVLYSIYHLIAPHN
jgi:hypothetical protein